MNKNPNFAVCETYEGWSLHTPGSTDDQIASGDAPALVSGPYVRDDAGEIIGGGPGEDDYAAATTRLRESLVAVNIAGALKPGIDPNHLAVVLVGEADIADNADDVTVEVPGEYTVNGNPISVTV